MSAANTGSDVGNSGGMSGRALLVVLLCWVAVIFDGYDLIVYGAVVPSLLDDPAMQMGAAQAGVVGSLALVGMIFVAMPYGFYAFALPGLLGAVVVALVPRIRREKATMTAERTWEEVKL